jgi:hypothetical protein
MKVSLAVIILLLAVISGCGEAAPEKQNPGEQVESTRDHDDANGADDHKDDTREDDDDHGHDHGSERISSEGVDAVSLCSKETDQNLLADKPKPSFLDCLKRIDAPKYVIEAWQE